MIWKTKSLGVRIIRMFIACFLILCLSLESPLSDLGPGFAAEDEEDSVEYVSNVRLFYSDDSMEAAITNCQENDFIPVRDDLNAGTEKNFVVLGYQTTKNRDEAVCSIKLLGMGDGYELKDYSEIEKEYRGLQSSKIDTLEAASDEFVSKYRDGSPMAIHAYEGLNMFNVPEAGGKGLGDYIVEGNADWDFYARIVTNSSAGTISSIISQLTYGLANYENEFDDESGEKVSMSWASEVANSDLWEELSGNLTEDDYDRLYKDYGDDAKDFHEKLQYFATQFDKANAEFEVSELKETIEEASEKETDEMIEDVLENPEDAGLDQAKYALYTQIYDTLNEYEADGDAMLGDYLLQIGYETSEDVDLTRLYPILDVMSYAQRRMVGIGGLEAIVSIAGENVKNEEVTEKVSEAREHIEELLGEDSISVWTNINQEIKGKKVAYTSDVIRMQSAQETIDTYDPTTWKDSVDEAMQWVSIATSVFSVLTILVKIPGIAFALSLPFTGLGLLCVAVGLTSIGGSILSFADTMAACALSTGPVGWIVTIVSIALTVIFWVAWKIYEEYEKNKDKEYEPVPEFVADRAMGGKGEYIAFYKSVGSVEDPHHEADGKQHGDAGIPDMNGRYGFEGWNCMYMSKDPNTGSPIVASEGKGPFYVVNGAGGSITGYDSIRTFGEKAPGNCNSRMKKDNVNGIFVHYLTEESIKNPVEGTSDNEASTAGGASKTGTKQYISDIKVASGGSEQVAKAKLKRKEMYIWDHNLATDTRKNYCRKEEWCYTYIGYKVSTNPKDAITDIRVATFANAANTGGKIIFGDISYGCAGTLGYPADDTTENSEFPSDLDGLWYTKNANAGTPIEVSGLHLVNSHEDSTGEAYVDKGWIPVTTFSGLPYNFATTRDSETKDWQPGRNGNYGYRYTCYATKDDNTWNAGRRYIYYEPEEKYTSGDTKYLSGIFFTFGSDSVSTKAKVGETEAKFSQLDDRIQEFPQAYIDTGSNLALPFKYEGYYVESVQKYLHIGYTWSYSPYRALTNIRAFQGTIYNSELPYNITKPTDGTTVGYASASVAVQRTGVYCEWVMRGISPENAYMAPNGLLGTNEQVPKGQTKYKPGGYAYTQDWMPWITTGLYVSGYYEKAHKLTLDDVIFSGRAHQGRNNDGVITTDVSGETTLSGKPAEGDFNSIQEMKAPYETAPFNIAYPAWKDDEEDDYHTNVITYYIYIRKPAIKKKYISKVFVGAFSFEDAKQDESAGWEVGKIVDQQALVSANGAASDEVIPANVAVAPERAWYGTKWKKNNDRVDTVNGSYFKLPGCFGPESNRLPWAPPDYAEGYDEDVIGSGGTAPPIDRPAAYLSVERTDKEDEAVKAVLLFKTDKDIVPERIEVDGATYYCASVSTPIKMSTTSDAKKQNYFVYYTTNAGVSPGQPIMELSVDDEVFISGYATSLCADKQDKSTTSAGGKKTKTEVAHPYGDGDLVTFIHANYARTKRMYFNRIYVANGDKRKKALAELLTQGCTEFLDMNLNDATTLTDEEMEENEKEDDEEDKKKGGDFVYFGYRGYSLDQKKINSAGNKDAQDEEKQSQLEEAVYDIVCTVGEDYHPEGIITEKNQLYYSPVSKMDRDGNTSGTDLNAGTNGPPIYMYFSTPWGASQYNNSVGNDSRKDTSTMPQDIFDAPITRFAFTRYDRVPYSGDVAAESSGNSSDANRPGEYVLCSDNKIPVDLNDGAVILNSKGDTENNKIMMFVQRESGKVKPAAEITGGYTTSTTQQGEMWLNK